MSFLERILQILEQLLFNFTSVIPNILGAIVVFLVGWVIAKTVALIVKKVLKSIQVDKLGEQLNNIDFISKSSVSIVPSTILSKLLYYVILLLFAIVASEILNVEPISKLVGDILLYMPKVFAGMIVLFIGLLVADFIKGIVETTTKSMGIPSYKMIGGVVFYFIFMMTIITAIKQIGIDAAFIETNLSYIIAGGVFAFALGYGLASKDMMSNFLASLYSKEKFAVGDVVAISGHKGEIVEMTNSSMIIRSEDNRKVIIPLSKLSTESIEIFDN
ncbi:MAG: small-conductance mechanosensitive channel [Polaribacter sp.]|jgi:small-conductance mechanosensitive channel